MELRREGGTETRSRSTGFTAVVGKEGVEVVAALTFDGDMAVAVAKLIIDSIWRLSNKVGAVDGTVDSGASAATLRLDISGPSSALKNDLYRRLGTDNLLDGGKKACVTTPNRTSVQMKFCICFQKRLLPLTGIDPKLKDLESLT